MRTNFYNALYIDDDGTRIQVDGPIDWEGGDGDCWISFTVTQGSVHAEDTTGHYNNRAHDWKKNTNARGGAFVPGPASAKGVIHGTSTPPPAPWPEQHVDLVIASERHVTLPPLEEYAGQA